MDWHADEQKDMVIPKPLRLYLQSTISLSQPREFLLQLNSLAPGGFENIFQNVFFKLISWIDTLSNSCETALRSMPQNPSDDKSTLVQVMAWCHQAASHYLSQCCPRSLSPYGVTRPQWVKFISTCIRICKLISTTLKINAKLSTRIYGTIGILNKNQGGVVSISRYHFTDQRNPVVGIRWS